MESFLPSLSPTAIVAFTDGACRGNPGPCGAAAAVIVPAAISNGIETEFLLSASLGVGTNNVGELWAIGLVLEFCRDRPDLLEAASDLYIFPNSDWAANTVQGRWNVRSNCVKFFHCPGHSGTRGNCLADSLANRAIDRAAREGTTFSHYSIANCDPGTYRFAQFITRRIPSDYG